MKTVDQQSDRMIISTNIKWHRSLRGEGRIESEWGREENGRKRELRKKEGEKEIMISNICYQ